MPNIRLMTTNSGCRAGIPPAASPASSTASTDSTVDWRTASPLPRGTAVGSYETDSFERIQSGPSPLASDPDPVQSGLVDQKPIHSSPIRLVRTVQIFVHSAMCIHTHIHLLISFVNMSVDFAVISPPKQYMFYDKNDLFSNMK